MLPDACLMPAHALHIGAVGAGSRHREAEGLLPLLDLLLLLFNLVLLLLLLLVLLLLEHGYTCVPPCRAAGT
jgi:hypothetical protein